MSRKKRRFSPLALVGLSLALLILPGSWTSGIRLTALAAYLPFQNAGQITERLIPGGSDRGETEALRTENDYLRDQVRQLIDENQILQVRLADASGIRHRQLVREEGYIILHAPVVLNADTSSWRRSITLALGSRGGVRLRMIVCVNNQLVGRVIEVGPWTSRVRLVTDPAFRAEAVATPKTYSSGVAVEKRHVGVYEGTAAGTGHLKWLLGDTPVKKGAYVLTTDNPLAGMPRGLVLGRVSGVEGTRAQYASVDVEPMVNFQGLEYVMLLGRRQETP